MTWITVKLESMPRTAAEREYNTEYHRRRREEDSDYHERRKEASKAWKARHIAYIRNIIATAKDRPCVDCGQQYHPCCMEFDHVRGEKKFGLAKSARTNRSIQEILDEIAKCEIRCVICHRLRHLAPDELGL